MELFRKKWVDKIRADHDKRGIPHDRMTRSSNWMNIGETLSKKWRKVAKNRNQAARGIADAKKSGNKEKLIKSWHRSRIWV